MLRTGQILGSYRIETLLGRGAMGVVYRGVGTGDGKPVAIKTVRADLLVGSEQEAILARFRQEAFIGMRLRHPRIAKVRDYGEQDEVIYLAMDFIEGQELGRLLERRPDLPLGMSLAIILQILNALAYAHGRAVIHRDIKPANILVRQDYTVVLTDFGIAHVSGSELTQTGDLLGSPLYMAPEQLRGELPDPRADLYSTGIVLYYLLTHRKPFAADSLAALMQQVLNQDPPPPSTLNRTIPAAFDSVLRRALAKDRERRFASALDFAAALRRARTAADESTVVVPGVRPSRSVNPPADTHPPAPVAMAPDERIERMAVLLRECMTERATRPRLDGLAESLEIGLAWAKRTSLEVADPAGQRLRELCAGDSFAALADLIEHDAPLPGRVLQEARGDWLELVRLFALLHGAGQQLGVGPAVEMARVRLIRQLTGAFLDYANTLNRLLFDDDSPQLIRISADFMRLDLLQLALEELGATAEGRGIQQILLLFANQVMGKINALIRAFLDRRDPLTQFGVASLLVETDELIVLAERLLEGGEADAMAAAGPGGAMLAEFIGNIRKLSRLIGRELYQQLLSEPRSTDPGALTAEQDQALFVGRLRKLGLLYRFAVHLETGELALPLRGLASEMHGFLEKLTELLIATPMSAGSEPTVATERLLARLSVIADLAEQFGWLELHQKILLAIRHWVVAS